MAQFAVPLSIDPDDEFLERACAHVQDLLALFAVDVLELDGTEVYAVRQVRGELPWPNWEPRAGASTSEMPT